MSGFTTSLLHFGALVHHFLGSFLAPELTQATFPRLAMLIVTHSLSLCALVHHYCVEFIPGPRRVT